MFPDISEFQGVVNWDALEAAYHIGNIEAVSMRAGFGTSRADNQFSRNQHECRARGIPAIFYWFNYPTFNTPQTEAAMFNQVVGPLQAHEAMMADFEDDPQSNSVFPRGQAGVDWAKAFLSAVEAPQNATWWYTYPALFNAVNFGPLLGTWPFVLADYRATPDPLVSQAIALQFTDCGSTAGVLGCCDQNRVLKEPLSQWLTGGFTLTQEQFNALMDGWLRTKNMSLDDLDALRWRVEALVANRLSVAGGPTAGEANALRQQLDQIRSGEGTDPAAFAKALANYVATKLTT